MHAEDRKIICSKCSVIPIVIDAFCPQRGGEVAPTLLSSTANPFSRIRFFQLSVERFLGVPSVRLRILDCSFKTGNRISHPMTSMVLLDRKFNEIH